MSTRLYETGDGKYVDADAYDSGVRAGMERAAALFDEVQQDVADRIRAELAGTEAATACPDCNGSGVVDDAGNTGCYGCGQGGVHESWCGLAPCPRGCPIPPPAARLAGTEVPR